MELQHHGIKGMRWGVRRYRNDDGSLTAAGQKRYDRDQRENAGKKKGNKVAQADPNRWVREDIERSKRLTDSTKQLNQELSNAVNRKSRKTNPKMDLSEMSDKELRERINREFMERQYNDLMNPVRVSRGKEFAQQALEVTGTVLGVASSALGIALAIKELKG